MKQFQHRPFLFVILPVACMCLAILLFGAGIMLNGIQAENPELNLISGRGFFIAGAVFLAVSSILFIAEYAINGKARAFLQQQIERKNREFSDYGRLKIENFKTELETTQENYKKYDSEADSYITRRNIGISPRTKPYFDFSVLKTGKIYYGCLVEANDMLFRQPQGAEKKYGTLPCVVIYSPDEYFESNPLELLPVAEALFADKSNNILKDELFYFSNYLVPENLSKGRKIYMTTVFAARAHLPFGMLLGNIFPVIANPDSSTSVFILDDIYWSKPLVSNYIHSRYSALYEQTKIFE